MRYALSNKKLAFVLDAQANVVELRNQLTGFDYAGGQGLWRIIYSHDEVLEDEIQAEACSPRIEKLSESQLRIRYETMPAPSGVEAFRLTIRIDLKDDELQFSADIENASGRDRVIREFNFPIVANINLAEGQALYGGSASGADRHVRIDDVAGAIQNCHTDYMADDDAGINMPWFDNGFAMFANGDDGFYLGDHDPAFEQTAMLFRKRGDEIDAGMHKSPFVGPGASRTFDGYVLSPYAGDWHVGAKKYRKWAEHTWYRPVPRPASVSEDFNGWYRLIMRHQYGKILFPHDEMPRILKSMKETGINSLLMFGWWLEGMDAGYPDYTFDQTQGGKKALAKHIQDFRANGGRVLLYFNARLIDTATQFYKKRGADIAIRGCDGEPLIERYMFSGAGIDLRHQFGYKSFALACPYSREWMEILKGYVDIAVELGVDGVFFDQIGMPELPCFGENHGHPVPATDSRAIRMSQMREIREYIRSRNPEMSFGVECATNFTSPFADYFHSFPGWNIASNDWEETGEKPNLTSFIELFRYTFPEALISDREIRDDTDIERRVNLALLRGLVSDVEVQRCRALIDETPTYKQYLTKANKLRGQYRRLILNGRFQDTDGATCDNPELSWSIFTAGDELALIATQSHLEKTAGTFQIPGYSYCEHDALGEIRFGKRDDGVSLALSRHALAVVVFRKAEA
jgi:hypothetical protein